VNNGKSSKAHQFIGGVAMGVPLTSLLKIGGLQDCKVVAGCQGMDKLVSNVTIMEVPDIVKWLKGNELLLTSLYPIKDDLDAQIQLIEKLSKAGTTALAIKPIRFIDSIPVEMKKEADRVGLTLIEIPEQISYLDILSPAMNVIFNKKAVLYDDLENATRLFNEISIAKGGFEDFIQTLSFLTRGKVYLESYVPYIHVPEQEAQLSPMTEGQMNELEVVQRPVRMERDAGFGKEESCVVAPIIIDGDLYGTITCWGFHSEYMEVHLAIQEKAATLLSLEFLREKVKYDIAQQYKNEFIRDLLFNQEMNLVDLEERGKSYRFKENELYLCIIVTEKESGGKRTFLDRISQMERCIKSIDADMITGVIRNSLLLLVPKKNRKNKELNKLAERLHFVIEQAIHTRIRLGIGSVYFGVNGLRKSFREAEKAIALGPRISHDQPFIYFSELGVYRLISFLEKSEELQQYYKDSVNILAEYDRENELNLIKTLEQYFACNESLKETAESLFVHVNTLKYRLQKIKDLTGYSLQNSEEKLMLHIGLKTHQYFSLTVDKDEKIRKLLSF
jgi:PucR family transcriptional regulator, purine catabolism regulatory protein